MNEGIQHDRLAYMMGRLVTRKSHFVTNWRSRYLKCMCNRYSWAGTNLLNAARNSRKLPTKSNKNQYSSTKVASKVFTGINRPRKSDEIIEKHEAIIVVCIDPIHMLQCDLILVGTIFN